MNDLTHPGSRPVSGADRADALVFDLDGTLWDAAAASTHGWNLALEEMGLSVRVTVAGIRSVSGTPFARCVETLLPELHPLAEAAVLSLEVHERAAIETMGGDLYDGVAEGLCRLAGSYRLFLVSNCPDWYLEAFLRMSGLRGCFEDWDCHGSSGTGKPQMLRGLAERHRLVRPVYVGDTRGDQEAAREAGMEFVFARYGFGEADGSPGSFGSFVELVRYFLA